MEIKEVKIPSSKSGKNIAAIIHYPQETTNRLMILCPGNLDSKDYDHLVELAKVFSERGYTVVRFDPLGTWDSDGTESDYLTSQYLNDVKSIIEYMLGRKAYTEIILGGHSRGAMVSILYASQDTRISKVIAIMPPSPLTEEELQEKKYVDWKENGFNVSIRDIPGSSDTKKYKLPYSHLVDRHNFDVMKAVPRIHVPIILVAGELDEVCLPEDVKSIFDKANEPKKYVLLKGIGHDYRHSLSEIGIVNKKIVDVVESV